MKGPIQNTLDFDTEMLEAISNIWNNTWNLVVGPLGWYWKRLESHAPLAYQVTLPPCAFEFCTEKHWQNPYAHLKQN